MGRTRLSLPALDHNDDCVRALAQPFQAISMDLGLSVGISLHMSTQMMQFLLFTILTGEVVARMQRNPLGAGILFCAVISTLVLLVLRFLRHFVLTTYKEKKKEISERVAEEGKDEKVVFQAMLREIENRFFMGATLGYCMAYAATHVVTAMHLPVAFPMDPVLLLAVLCYRYAARQGRKDHGAAMQKCHTDEESVMNLDQKSTIPVIS